MMVSVLVVTSMQGFGELLKSSLDETGRFQVFLATSEVDALRYVRAKSFDLGIFDADMEDGYVPRIAEEFEQLQPSAHWALIPPENDPSHPSITWLKPDGYLTKPFYLPDLITTLDRIMQAKSDNSDLMSPLAVDFNQLVQNASARAGFILHDNEVVARSHEITESTVYDLGKHLPDSMTFRANSSTSGRMGAAKVIPISELAGEYILYATLLKNDGILALVFDLHTPLSQVRGQTAQLMKALAAPSLASSPYLDSHSILPKRPLLEGVPPSRPAKNISLQKKNEQPFQGTREPDVAGSNPWWEIASLPESPSTTSVGQSSFPVVICDLNYTGLMVPRLPRHRIIGGLADKLSKWISQISIAFGWRLGQLTLLPEYMLWVVSLPPEISPAQLIRVMRQRTSQSIFAEYPALTRENPSGDFWASGYLIMSGTHVVPAQAIESFIQQIRQYQGVAGSIDRDLQS